MDEISVKKVSAFIAGQKLMVVSTSDGTKPESALVAFAETERFELVFATSDKTRKYRNLRMNPSVACVIGCDYAAAVSVQYEGTAKELTGDDIVRYAAILFAKQPGSAKYAKNPDEHYFIVTPTWLRYLNYSAGVTESFEIKDFPVG